MPLKGPFIQLSEVKFVWQISYPGANVPSLGGYQVQKISQTDKSLTQYTGVYVIFFIKFSTSLHALLTGNNLKAKVTALTVQ